LKIADPLLLVTIPDTIHYENKSKQLYFPSSGNSFCTEWEAEKGGGGGEDGIFHEGLNTRAGREKSFYSSIQYFLPDMCFSSGKYLT
jgi:hypothetical protein